MKDFLVIGWVDKEVHHHTVEYQISNLSGSQVISL